ncbi:MAG: hypothetical protein P8X47_12150 [Ignavibacteriaceae bacterium]|jgi:hypothetical protein
MNKKQKVVLLFGFILIAAAIVIWIISGSEFFSKDGIWVQKPLTELEKSLGLEPQLEFHKQFVLGLLPHIAVFIGVVVVISGFLFFMLKTKKDKEKK